MSLFVSLVPALEKALLDAGIPIEGVRVGNPDDRTTWVAFYAANATPAQRTQGDQILATIDPQGPTTIATYRADLTASATNRDEIIAAIQTVWEAIPAPTSALDTLAKVRTRFLQILRSRQ
jgi:hypothetical protein